MEYSSNIQLKPFNDRVAPLVDRFCKPAPIHGIVDGVCQISRGFVGTFLSPFSDQMGRLISGDAIHRADLVAGYGMSLRGLFYKMQEEQAKVSALKNHLVDHADTLTNEEKETLTCDLLAQKEALQDVKRSIVDRRCHVLARMRGFFGENPDVSHSDKQLMSDIEEAYAQCLQDFDRVEADLATIQKEKALHSIWTETMVQFLEVVPPSREDLEQRMELAKHPWMREGMLAFVERHLGMGQMDTPAAERALNALNGMFSRTLGPQLSAGDLQQVIRSMEQSLEGRSDTDSRLQNTLIALKALTAEACLEHPDELRRVLSLATFLFVGAVSGGTDGMMTAGFAKTAVDYFLSNLLPAANPDKPESTFSQVLRVVEAGILVSSGGVAAAGAYAASEVAHYHLPKPMKPILVFGAAHFGLGLGAGAATGITVVSNLPHTTLDTMGKVRHVVGMLRNPKEIPAAVSTRVRKEVQLIRSAIHEERWNEAALRVSAVALPAIFLTLALANVLVPLAASGLVLGVTLHAGFALSGLLTATALWAVMRLDEQKKKQAMLATMQEWRRDYERSFPDPAQRDQAVLAIFEAMEQRIITGQGVQREYFLELLQTHIPAFEQYSLEELGEALDDVGSQLNPDASLQRALDVGESLPLVT